MRKKDSTASKPSWAVSLALIAVLVGLMFCVIRVFGADALDGGSQVVLLLMTGIVIAVSMIAYSCPWERLEEAIKDNLRAIGSAVVILLLIGAISGSWMVSGIVPTLICYGLKVITPSIFLFATCLICALVSLMTGSSWTTVATIGVALIAIGSTLGYSPAMSAGAILSGAYFGDKISPLSDTTVLASSASDTPLFTHIRYMMITTVPSFTITLVIFLVMSLCHAPASDMQIGEVSGALEGAFTISPWLLIVPVVTGVMIAKKIPAIITLLCAAIMAEIAALLAQPDIILGIAGTPAGVMDAASAFKGTMISLYGSTAVQTGNEAINSLVQTRGINGMLPTVFLIVSAAAMGGAMIGSGMIESITAALAGRIQSRTSLVSATVGTGFFSNLVVGDQFLSIILTTSLYKGLYRKMGYEGRLLSRSTEDSATVTSVLIPWNSCGMTQSTVLHVATLDYLPYCFFNIISPLMSITIAVLGYRIFRLGTDVTPTEAQ